MRPYLALDTSTPLGSIAVGRGEELLAEVTVGVSTRHSESLLPAVDFALKSAGLEPSALGGVIVGAGPGSFTGVRIAAATAKAMVRTLDVPLLAFSSLAAVAATMAGCRAPVCAMFDARRGEVYAGCYAFEDDGAMSVVLEDEPAPVEGLVSRLADRAPIFVGGGALQHRDVIERSGGRVVPTPVAVLRAGALLWLAESAPEAGRIHDPAAWEPEYLRPAGVERMARG